MESIAKIDKSKTKSKKSIQLIDKAYSLNSQNTTTIIVSKDSKSKVKSSDELGMGTDQAEWLDTLLSQYLKVLNKKSGYWRDWCLNHPQMGL